MREFKADTDDDRNPTNCIDFRGNDLANLKVISHMILNEKKVSIDDTIFRMRLFKLYVQNYYP